MDHTTDCCSICLDNLTAKSHMKTMCNHTFHQECIEQWLCDKTTCPACRRHVGKIVMDSRKLPYFNIGIPPFRNYYTIQDPVN